MPPKAIAAAAPSTDEEMSQKLRSAQLERVYERVLRQSEIIYEEEKNRVLRVERLLLEDENFSMQDELAAVEERNEQLEDQYEMVCTQRDEAQDQLESTHSELLAARREEEKYKAELQALRNVSADSTRLLTEKLALSRELANLMPELEHLRSQAASNQNILSEKLALQREVSSLQVELETEKRAIQRMKAKDNKSNEEDGKAQSQLEELRRELAKERKDSQKIQRDLQKQIAEVEGQKGTLEGKLGMFRDTLRATKTQLKETREELEKAQLAAKAASRSSFDEARAPKPANPRKRNVARFDPDATIGTPGESHAAKRARFSVTAPGEKSTFSITPFLNKTTSILMDTPDSTYKDGEKEAEAESSPVPASRVTTAVAVSAALKPKSGKPGSVDKEKPKPLQEKTNPRANTAVGPARKAMSKTSLPKVTEEADEENEGTENLTKTSLHLNPTKKKQKILGGRAKSTLFDEDEAEQPKPRARTLLSGARSTALRAGALSLTAKPRTLAEFSPLKKDRKSA